MITFITGGARSGKSCYAEKLAMAYDDVTYVATALAFDDEMKERIETHRARATHTGRKSTARRSQ